MRICSKFFGGYSIGLYLLLGLFLCFGWANPTRAEIISSDITAYYSFDTNTQDQIGIFDLTANGSASITSTSKFGAGSAQLAGSGSYLSRPYHSPNSSQYSLLMTDSQPFTLSLWFKSASMSNADYSILFSSELNPNNNLTIRATDDTIQFLFDNYVTGHSVSIYKSGFNLDDNTWHNLIIQGSPNTFSSNFKIYLDGSEVTSMIGGFYWASEKDGNAFQNATPATNSVLNNYIGFTELGTYAPFTGYIDDVAWFNKLLSPAEITDLQTHPVSDYLTNAISGQIYWMGVGTQFGRLGANWSIPYYFNVCNDFDDIKAVQVNLCRSDDGGNCDTVPSQNLIFDRTTFIGPQNCSGQMILTGPILDEETATGTANLELQILDLSDNTTYINSGNFNFTINNGAGSEAYLDTGIVSPLRINTTTSATTTIPFGYNFTGLSWSGGQICVFNNDSQAKTNFCTSITAASGLTNMAFTNPPGNYTLNAKYALYNSGGNKIFESSNFQIIWFGWSPTIVDDYLGTSTAAFVCTQDEWASTDWWVKIKCSTFKTGLDVANAIASVPSKAAQGTIESLKQIFPFNLPISILSSWNDSANTQLPSELSWLAPQDENNNINLTLPSSLFGATSTIPIWGPQVYYANSQLEAVFDHIKVLSKYLLWILFIMELIALGKAIMEDIEGQYGSASLTSFNTDAKGRIQGGHYSVDD